MAGIVPDKVIDHSNRDRLDCRRENLRHVTVAENNHNRGPIKGRNYVGVFKRPDGTYCCKFKHGATAYNFAAYLTEEDAARARDIEMIKLCGHTVFLNCPYYDCKIPVERLPTDLSFHPPDIEYLLQLRSMRESGQPLPINHPPNVSAKIIRAYLSLGLPDAAPYKVKPVPETKILLPTPIPNVEVKQPPDVVSSPESTKIIVHSMNNPSFSFDNYLSEIQRLDDEIEYFNEILKVIPRRAPMPSDPDSDIWREN